MIRYAKGYIEKAKEYCAITTTIPLNEYIIQEASLDAWKTVKEAAAAEAKKLDQQITNNNDQVCFFLERLASEDEEYEDNEEDIKKEIEILHTQTESQKETQVQVTSAILPNDVKVITCVILLGQKNYFREEDIDSILAELLNYDDAFTAISSLNIDTDEDTEEFDEYCYDGSSLENNRFAALMGSNDEDVDW